MSNKPTNPKDALGIRKAPLHCVPCRPLFELGLAMMEGGRKYGAHNYRAIGVRASTYYDAAMRHLTDWWEGQDVDPDSGVHHIVKAIACLFVIRDSMHMGNCEDDRPIKYPDGLNISEFNKVASELINKYPNCAEPFLEKKMRTIKVKCAEPDCDIYLNPEHEGIRCQFCDELFCEQCAEEFIECDNCGCTGCKNCMNRTVGGEFCGDSCKEEFKNEED